MYISIYIHCSQFWVMNHFHEFINIGDVDFSIQIHVPNNCSWHIQVKLLDMDKPSPYGGITIQMGRSNGNIEYTIIIINLLQHGFIDTDWIRSAVIESSQVLAGAQWPVCAFFDGTNACA